MQTILRRHQSATGSKWVIGAIDDDPIFESRHFSDAFCGRVLLDDLQEATLARRWAVTELLSGSGLRSILMLFSKKGAFLGTTVVVHEGHYTDEKIFAKW